MRMRHGVNPHLEDAANEILRQSMAGVTSHEAKRDILTPWKEKDRRSREVYAGTGVVDPALRRGNFNRVANKAAPHLNSIEGKVAPLGRTAEAHRPRTDRTMSLRQFLEDQQG